MGSGNKTGIQARETVKGLKEIKQEIDRDSPEVCDLQAAAA